MIRLNEKGFAVSTILYGILTLTILILMLIFGIMKSSKDMNEGLIESLTASMNKCVFYEVKLENCYIDGNSDCQTFIDEYKSCVATKNDSNNADEENPVVYKINASSNNTSYGTVSVTSPTVIHGETAYITFSPNSGYVYDSNSCGGSLLGSLENTLRIPNVTKDIECTVTFKPSMHTVSVSLHPSGTTEMQLINASTSEVSNTGTISVTSGTSIWIYFPSLGEYTITSNTCGATATMASNMVEIANVTKDISCLVTLSISESGGEDSGGGESGGNSNENTTCSWHYGDSSDTRVSGCGYCNTNGTWDSGGSSCYTNETTRYDCDSSGEWTRYDCY